MHSPACAPNGSRQPLCSALFAEQSRLDAGVGRRPFCERATHASPKPQPHTDPARPRQRLCLAHPPNAWTFRRLPTPACVIGPAAPRTPSTCEPGDWRFAHAHLRCFDPVNDTQRFSILPPLPNIRHQPPRAAARSRTPRGRRCAFLRFGPVTRVRQWVCGVGAPGSTRQLLQRSQAGQTRPVFSPGKR